MMWTVILLGAGADATIASVILLSACMLRGWEVLYLWMFLFALAAMVLAFAFAITSRSGGGDDD